MRAFDLSPCTAFRRLCVREVSGLAESTPRRTADAFDELGLISLFRPTKKQRA